MIQIHAQEDGPELKQKLRKRQLLQTDSLPQPTSAELDNVQLSSQQPELEHLPAAQLNDSAAAMSKPLLNAFVHDSMKVMEHKLDMLVTHVLRRTDRTIQFWVLVSDRLSKWTDAEVIRFHSTTYAYLHARYLADDANAMNVVMEQIIEGIV